MAIYEGKVRVRLHPKKGIFLDRGKEGSTLTAANAAEILTTMVNEAKARKVGIDRWSLFIPELKATMAKDAVIIPVAKVEKYIAEGGREAVIVTNQYGGPRLLYASPMRKSTIEDIA